MKRPSRLRAYIERDAGALIGVLRLYLSRAGITDQPLESAANDLLNDVFVEALAHESRFRDDGQPRAWMLGIAANLIRRRQAEQIRRNQREPLARDLFNVCSAGWRSSPGWMAKRWLARSEPRPAQRASACTAHSAG